MPKLVAHVASATLLEAFTTEHVGRAKLCGHEQPLGIECPKARLDRRAQIAVDDHTSLEGILLQATEAVNNAANDHVGLLSRKEPAISILLAACPVESVTGQAASALAAVGRDTPVELSGYGSRPAPFHELGQGPGRGFTGAFWALGSLLWRWQSFGAAGR